MCGIAGLVQRTRNDALRMRFTRHAQDLLRSRGPDAQTFTYIDDRVSLVHTRLSIIDLASGAQPMQDDEGAIVFNGEIYNYKDLRLPQERYLTTSDTEVLLKGMHRNPLEFLPLADGMFAFGYFNNEDNSILLARDRFGIKSIYYYIDDDIFAFSSTITPLMMFSKGEINVDAFHEYYLYRAARAPKTIFADIAELPAGEALVFDVGRHRLRSPPSRWAPPFSAKRTTRDEGVALEAIDRALKLSIERHLVSDVPVATFLSGGVDSSLITGMAARHVPDLAAFTVGFTDPKFDETPFAALLCRQHGIRHHVLYTDADSFLSALMQWPLLMDDAVADPSAIMLHKVASFARDCGFKVLLSGEGADELFAGYNQQFRFHLAKAIPPFGRRALAPFSRHIENKYPKRSRLIQYSKQFSSDTRFFGSSMIFEPFMSEEIFRDPVTFPLTSSNISEALIHDQSLRLPNDILTRTDRATMASGIEARVPFLTSYVQEAANSVDASLLLSLHEQKKLLKRYAERFVPRECLYRKKVGFDLPLAKWMRGPLRDILFDHISNSWQNEFFAKGVLESVALDHMEGANDNADKLFAFLLLEMNVLGLRALGKAMRADSGSMPAAGGERPVLHHSWN